MNDTIDIKIIETIEEFQCPGCTNGGDTKCGAFEQKNWGKECSNHSAGTLIVGVGKINLGLPNGFNRMGALHESIKSNIRILDKETAKGFFDVFNLPTWTLEYKGHLLVRTYIPRKNISYVDIIRDFKASDIDFQYQGSSIENFEEQEDKYASIDVSKFHDLID